MIRQLKSLWALREGLAFQLGLWGLAIGIGLTLLSTLRELDRADALKAELAVPTIDTRNAPLHKEDYLAVRERVGRAHSETRVKFVASDDALTVKADKLDDYALWRMALADVMLSMPGAVWTVKSMCAGEKCTDGAYSASVMATVRTFAVGSSTTTTAALASPAAAPTQAAAPGAPGAPAAANGGEPAAPRKAAAR